MRRGVVIGSWWGVLCSLVVAIHGGCHFPKDWSGHWFQSGVPHLLNITLTTIETKGECVENQGDKFIIEDKAESCYRCVVIHEKHENVLQYKETYCDERQSLDQMCGQITGDANLFSMFRTNPAKGPVPCPFKGAPFTFTYSRGSGECGSPVSRVDSCTDESRLLLRYQACPDVHGTESTVEELVCLATWKDGSTKYLVGKLKHKMATSDEDRYRCFVYEQHHQHNHHQIYQVAQSGDATCNGLPSAMEGSRTMRLTTIENQHNRCRFPSFVTDHHHWHTLDHSRSYSVLHKNTTLHITKKEGGDQEMRVVCHSEHHMSHHQVTIVAHTTSGCDSGYVCMVFYKRDGHVIELQQSTQIVQVPEEACSPANFNPASLPFITLITASLHKRKCPYLGRYTINGLSVDGQQVTMTRRKRKRSEEKDEVENTGVDSKMDCSSYDFESLVVGCSEKSDTMEFYSSCDTETVSAYFCHGSWDDNGTSYLIASPVSRKSVGARRYCFIYTHSGGDSGSGLSQHADSSKRSTGSVAAMLHLSSVTESCHRNISPGVTGAWALNLTINGQCAEASTSSMSVTAVTLPSLFFIVTLAVVISNMR